MPKSKDSEKRSERFNSIKSANDFANRIGGKLQDLRSYPESKSNFKVTYTKKDSKINGHRVGEDYLNSLPKLKDPRDNVTTTSTSSNNDIHDYIDDEDDDFNSSNCSEDWISNCNGADIPDHIDASTAYFDEEGNYAGGTLRDLNED
jgi:hypothetical protein